MNQQDSTEEPANDTTEHHTSNVSISQSRKSVHFADYDEISTIEPLPPRNYRIQCTLCSAMHVKDVIPIIRWLPKYEWKFNILNDLIAGVSVAVLHVPQGLGYALLSNVPPVVGIYMGTYPVIIYSLFGTSRHLSVGTFAPVAIMTGAIVNVYTNNTSIHAGSRTVDNIVGLDSYELQVASTVAVCVGFWQLAAFFLRLGFLATILSKTLMSAFTAGAAFHILFAQIPHLLGLKTAIVPGIFTLIYTSKAIAFDISQINVSAIVSSTITCIILTINVNFIKPRIEGKINRSLPMELIVIIIAILVTKFCKLNEKFSMPIVGYIPSGFHKPLLPDFSLLNKIYFESMLVALVSYAIATSIAMHIGTMDNYEINPNQEFFALGVANLTCAFLSCIPVGGSLSRTMVQFKSGGRTQLTGFFCAIILVVTILWISPIFEKLPKSVLAVIIVVALYPVSSQILQFPKIWKISRQDGILWLATFVGVIILDIAYGLAIGVLVAILFIYYHSTTPYVCKLGRIILKGDSGNKENDVMFIDMRHVQASEIPGVRIIQISSRLHFANRAYLKETIIELSGVNPDKILKCLTALRKAEHSEEEIMNTMEEMKTVEWRLGGISAIDANSPHTHRGYSYYQTKSLLQYVILDLSLVDEIDQVSIIALQHLVKLYRETGIEIVVTSRKSLLMVHLFALPNIRTALKELHRVRHGSSDVVL